MIFFLLFIHFIIINSFEVTIYDYKIEKYMDGYNEYYAGYLKGEYNYNKSCLIKIISGLNSYNDTLSILNKFVFGKPMDIEHDTCIEE